MKKSMHTGDTPTSQISKPVSFNQGKGGQNDAGSEPFRHSQKDQKGALPQFKPEELQPAYYALSLSPGHLDQPTIPITEVRVDEGVGAFRIRAKFGNRDLDKRGIAVVLDGKQLDIVNLYFHDVGIEECDVLFGGATKAIFWHCSRTTVPSWICCVAAWRTYTASS